MSEGMGRGIISHRLRGLRGFFLGKEDGVSSALLGFLCWLLVGVSLVSGGSGNFTICPSGCDYATLAAWESGEDGNLTGTGPCIAIINESFVDTAAVTFSGWTTTESDYIKVMTTGEARHSGVWGSGYILNVTASGVYVTENFFKIDGLQMYSNSSSQMIQVDDQDADNLLEFSNLILKKESGADGDGINFQDGNINAEIWNSIIYIDDQTEASTITEGIGARPVNSLYVYNTVVNGFNDCYERDNGVMYVYNSVAFNCSTDFDGVVNVSYSASDDGTGDNSVQPADWEDVFEDYLNGDFRLKAGSALIDSGTTISSFSDDVIGTRRPQGSAWDIGAFEVIDLSSKWDIPEDAGSPFYVNSSVLNNPYVGNCSNLLAGESCVLTWSVFPNGTNGTSYEFFAYGDSEFYYNVSGVVNVSIVGLPEIVNVSDFNESGVVDGSVEVGDNVTINVTLESDVGVDKVWVKVWEGAVGISSVIYEGFLSLIGAVWTVTFGVNNTFGLGGVNYTVFVNNTFGEEVNESGNFSVVDLTAPDMEFVDPTPADSANVTDSYVEVNVSIWNASDLAEVIWGWNGSNVSVFDSYLVAMFNLDNVSGLGENDSLVVDVSGNGNNGTVGGGSWAVGNGKYGGGFAFVEGESIAVDSVSEIVSKAYWSYNGSDWRHIVVSNGTTYRDGVEVCSSDMAYIDKLGGYCIDRYEASMPSANSTDMGNATEVADRNAGGAMMAESKVGVVPWVDIDQINARVACDNAGKHLCTSEEWLGAANLQGQVFDLPSSLSVAPYGCVVDSGTWCLDHSYAAGDACNTGYNVSGVSGCYSSEGVYDTVGNVWEWVNDTVDVINSGSSGWKYLNESGEWQSSTVGLWTKYGQDGVYFPVTNSGRGVYRGGFWSEGARSGLFSSIFDRTPDYNTFDIGFRCCDS